MTNYKPGDKVWQAEAEYSSSRPADIVADWCETEAEAIEDARYWLGNLTSRERERAAAWVRQYKVTGVDSDGQIESAVSTNAACWDSGDED